MKYTSVCASPTHRVIKRLYFNRVTSGRTASIRLTAGNEGTQRVTTVALSPGIACCGTLARVLLLEVAREPVVQANAGLS